MYASGLVAVKSGKRGYFRVQTKTAFVIRQGMRRASLDVKSIPSNAYLALPESGYRARDQKGQEAILRRLEPRTEGFSRRVGMDDESRILT